MSRTERKRNMIGWLLLALAVLLMCVLIFQNFQSATERDTAQTSAATSQQQKKNLAEEVADACESGQVVKSSAGVDLCERAATIAQQPVTTAGPQGPRGLPGQTGDMGPVGATGKAGADGKDSTVPGPAGSNGAAGVTGASGADSTIAGQQGAAGANSTVPGPQGVPGVAGDDGAPGKDGATGSTGNDGRGIKSVECVGDGAGSYWQITYTDGTAAQSSGPCKVAAAQPIPTPTP